MNFSTNSRGVIQITDKIGNKFTIENVAMNWTVLKLKQEVSSKQNISINTFDLRFTNQLLQDRRKLFSYHIHPGYTITILFKPGYVIKDLGENKIYIPEARSDWTVLKLKNSIASIKNVATQRITLMFDSKILQDTQLLRSFHIEPESCGLYIQELNGAKEHLSNALTTWTAKVLKSDIQRLKQLAWDTIDLHFDGEILEDDRILSSYNIKNGDTVLFALRDGILIMELGGKYTRIRNARDDWTISQLKIAVYEYTGLEPDFIQLVYMGGKLCDDSRRISDFLHSKDIPIVVLIRPDGGLKSR